MKNIGKLILTLTVAIMCGGVCMACYSSNDLKEISSNLKDSSRKVTINRTVGYFSKIESSTLADIKFVQGKKNSVRIVGNKSLVDNLQVEVKGETLVLSSKNKRGNRLVPGTKELNVYVTSPDLTALTLRGSGDFETQTNIDTDNMSVSIMGSSDVDFRDVVCDNITFEVRGSGDIEAKSIDCNAAVVSIYGSGDVSVDNLSAKTADVSVRGSGDVDLNLRGVAKTRAAVYGSGDVDLNFINCGSAECKTVGSGDIELKGNLRDFSKSVKGSGYIDTKGLRVGGTLR